MASSSLERIAQALLTAGMAVLAVSAVSVVAAQAPAKPQRVVSTNLCVDEMVLRLAERRNVASVTWLSLNAEASNVSELARGIPINHGLAEEIIPLRPDLVIAGKYTARPGVALLKRIGVRTVDVDVPYTLDEMRQQYRTVAALLGEQERGENLIGEMEERLAAYARNPPATRLRALLLNPNGYTVGRGSLVDEVITRAGLENVAVDLGVGPFGQVPLEAVVMSAVDVLIVSASRDGPPSMATELLRHPALVKSSSRAHVVVLPNRLWNCAGPESVEAVERLRQAAKAAQLSVPRKVARE
jgi:iron complex transport system substrate-binding protein